MQRLLLPLLLALCGCDADSAIGGSLLDESDAGQVSFGDSGEPVDLELGAFQLDGVAGDTIVLFFGGGDAEDATMRIVGLPGGARLTLHGIWFDDGLAFPNSVELDKGDPVSINGIRYAAPEKVDGEMTAAGTVLALSREDATLLMRPFDAGLPDLRIMLGAGAVLETDDGETIEFGRLQFGDTISVHGIANAGYLLATQIGMPAPVGEESSQRSGDAQEEDDAREDAAREDAAREERDRRAEARDDGDKDRVNAARRGVGRGRGGGR